uniref:Uncharacterized protein n=1 Tax=Physcomitrium patens TaxID=3218 RepID=A0A2K1KN26_PHYPA|nr:hypothetical protein PHYPA_006071 [Physcomitrium patens]
MDTERPRKRFHFRIRNRPDSWSITAFGEQCSLCECISLFDLFLCKLVVSYQPQYVFVGRRINQVFGN